MILHRAQFLERPGFWLPTAIANAIGEETKLSKDEGKMTSFGKTTLFWKKAHTDYLLKGVTNDFQN
jgi:hypothetical protein